MCVDIDTCQITGGSRYIIILPVVVFSLYLVLVQPSMVCFTCSAMAQHSCAFYLTVFVLLFHLTCLDLVDL